MTEPATPSVVTSGSVLSGRYRLEEEIGRGGAGQVFRAHDERLDRAVAVKVLTDLGSTALTRFRREAAAAARIRHVNVVTLFDAGVHDDGMPYLVMSLVGGVSLSERVKESGPLAPDELRRLARDLFAGLEATHRAGVLHRDLTPRNVLFDDDGSALLADFGIARRPEDPDLTAEHTVMGTRPFVAPERLRGREATVASDLYATGITLRFAATGDHATPMPHDHALAPLVEACTAADPARRPASAADATALLDELTGPHEVEPAATEAVPLTEPVTMVATSAPTAPPPPDDGAPEPRPEGRASSHRPAAAVGVLVALCAAALVGSLTVGGSGDPAADASDGQSAATSGAAADTTGAPTFDPDAPVESSRRLAEWLRAQDGG